MSSSIGGPELLLGLVAHVGAKGIWVLCLGARWDLTLGLDAVSRLATPKVF